MANGGTTCELKNLYLYKRKILYKVQSASVNKNELFTIENTRNWNDVRFFIFSISQPEN